MEFAQPSSQLPASRSHSCALLWSSPISHLSSHPVSREKDFNGRGFGNLSSGNRLSCSDRVHRHTSISNEQYFLGRLPSKVTLLVLRKKLRCYSYQGDETRPPATDLAALSSLGEAIQFQAREETRLFFSGPTRGDLAEIEAFCRLYRHAECLHSTVMNALCNDSNIENFDKKALGPDIGDASLVEEKVASGLAHLMALLYEGKSQFFGGTTTSRGDRAEEASPDDLPPFACFRKEVRNCCRALEDALEPLLATKSEQLVSIQRRMLKLKNACLDAGFPRPEGIPSHADIPNLAPVRLWPSKNARTLYKDGDVAFWRGGEITEEGVEWLVDKGFKTIVDLREGSAPPVARSILPEAVASGKLVVVRIPVERGTVPSEQQVEEFSRLVAESRNKPLYLQTQAGVGRASAMVSSWREVVLKEQLQVSKERKESGNVILANELELLTVADIVKISQEDALALDIPASAGENTYVSVSLTSNSENGAVKEASVPLDSNCASSVKDASTCAETLGEAENGRLLQENAEDGAQSHSDITKNAFEAQRPVADLLSRKAISKFMERKRVPSAYFAGRTDRAVSSLNSSSNRAENYASGNIAGPANRWGLATPGIPRADSREMGSISKVTQEVHVMGGPGDGVSDQKASEKNGDVRAHLIDGIAANSADVADGNEGQEKEDVGNHLQGPPKGSNRVFFRVPVGSSIDDGDEPVSIKGDMCASTTGVVRLQSRKKAEMFLVRTDGYSCTRERVKESTLAFTHPSTQQQMLMWKTPPRTVMLLKKLGSELLQELQEVASFLHHQEGINVVVEPEVHDRLARLQGFGFVQTFYHQDTSELHERVDFVVCLGGDGVILHASNLFRKAIPPVVSFNLGSLGFLTSHTFKDYKHDLQAIIHGHSDMMTGVYITLRMRLRCELYRNGKAVPGKVFEVLNEVVVDRGSNPYLCKIECYERNRLITKVQADGVIVATPTGSTAYSTAAGGSMVHPNVPCMLFTPICPHSLSFRPVILPDSALLELKVPRDARNNAWVSFDGKKRQQLSKGDSVRICMSEHPLPTVNKSDQTDDWFQSLVRCLNWNERLEQMPLSIS